MLHVHILCSLMLIYLRFPTAASYAQLADSMLCADKFCSETISEGKARLAYRPRDEKFLSLEKGEVVLVKSKNAGKKSHLWGGQVMGGKQFGFFPSSFIKEYIVLVKKPEHNVSIKEFLINQNGERAKNVYAGLISGKQKASVAKPKKEGPVSQTDIPEAVEKKDDLTLTDTESWKTQDENTIAKDNDHQFLGEAVKIHENVNMDTESVEVELERAMDDQNFQENDHEEVMQSPSTVAANVVQNIEKFEEMNPVDYLDALQTEGRTENTLDNKSVYKKFTARIDEVLQKDAENKLNSRNNDFQTQQNVQVPTKYILGEDVQQTIAFDQDINVACHLEKPNNKSPGGTVGTKARKSQNEKLEINIPEVGNEFTPGNTRKDGCQQLSTVSQESGEPGNVDQSHEQSSTQPSQTGESKIDIPKTTKLLTDVSNAARDVDDLRRHLIMYSNLSNAQSEPFNEDMTDVEYDELNALKHGNAKVLTTGLHSVSTVSDTSDATQDSISVNVDETYLGDISLDMTSAVDTSRDTRVDVEQRMNHDFKDGVHLAEGSFSVFTPVTNGLEKENSYLVQEGSLSNQNLPSHDITFEANEKVQNEHSFSTEMVREPILDQEMGNENHQQKSIPLQGYDIVSDSAPDSVELLDESNAIVDNSGASVIYGTKIVEKITDDSSLHFNSKKNDNEFQDAQYIESSQPKYQSTDLTTTAQPAIQDEIRSGYAVKKSVPENIEHLSDGLNVESNLLAQDLKSIEQRPRILSTCAKTEVELKNGNTVNIVSVEANEDLIYRTFDSPENSLMIAKSSQETDSLPKESGFEITENKWDVADDSTEVISIDSEKSDTEIIDIGDDIKESTISRQTETFFLNAGDKTVDRNCEGAANVHDENPLHPAENEHEYKSSKMLISASKSTQPFENRQADLEYDPVIKDTELLDKASLTLAGKSKVMTNKNSLTSFAAVPFKYQDGLSEAAILNGDASSSELNEKTRIHGILDINSDIEESKNFAKEISASKNQSVPNSELSDGGDSNLEMRGNIQPGDDKDSSEKESGISEERRYSSENQESIDKETNNPTILPDVEENAYVLLKEENHLDVDDKETKASRLNASDKIDVATSDMENDGDRYEKSVGDSSPTFTEHRTLYEGRVVDWDETLESKKQILLTWDESIGSDDDFEGSSLCAKDVDDVIENSEPNESTHSKYTSANKKPSILNEIFSQKLSEKHFHPEQYLKADLLINSLEKPANLNQMKLQKNNGNCALASSKVFNTAEQLQSSTKTVLPSTPFVESQAPVVRTIEQQTHLDSSNLLNCDEISAPPPILPNDLDCEFKERTSDILRADFNENFEQELKEVDEHNQSFWLRLLFAVSSIPEDILYICEPLLELYSSLMPPEFQNGIYGVSWSAIFLTFFIASTITWLSTCRAHIVKKKNDNKRNLHVIDELKAQIESLSLQKVGIENDLTTRESEVDVQKCQLSETRKATEDAVTREKIFEESLQQYRSENESLKKDVQVLNKRIQEKDEALDRTAKTSERNEKSFKSQQDQIHKLEEEIHVLRGSLSQKDKDIRQTTSSADKLKEQIRSLEKAKVQTGENEKHLRGHIDDLEGIVKDLRQRLDVETVESNKRKQEIEVLKDCILQFKGTKEYLSGDEDPESEEFLNIQNEKIQSLFDVAKVKKLLLQTEADRLQVACELEAERKSLIDCENKIMKLEAIIQKDQTVRNKLETDKQTLESKLAVIQDFYAKREVEIQSKLGLEQSKCETNASLLEDEQKQHSEVLHQLDIYKKMCEEAKKKYDESERKHKQEIVGFEKKAHDNWLACREAERKFMEADKHVNHLLMEVADLKVCIAESRQNPILRPRPERRGLPQFAPKRGSAVPGIPGSPLHFRNGPNVEAGGHSPIYKRLTSPSGGMSGDRPPSRSDRPQSAHSLPPMDKRPSGPHYDSRASFRDAPPTLQPHLSDVAPHTRFATGSVRPPSGPALSSLQFERRPIVPSESIANKSEVSHQSTLHATPPKQVYEKALRNDDFNPAIPLKMGSLRSSDRSGNALDRS